MIAYLNALVGCIYNFRKNYLLHARLNIVSTKRCVEKFISENRVFIKDVLFADLGNHDSYVQVTNDTWHNVRPKSCKNLCLQASLQFMSVSVKSEKPNFKLHLKL